jgi:conjugal transfer mating pair stabilization protein TraG
MYEIITHGGGQFLYQSFNAVAAWTGGGGYRGFLQVFMIIAFLYTILIVLFNMQIKALLNWFLGTFLIYGILMVPTVKVRVIDTTNPAFGASVVDNVPLGLALMASTSSQLGDWFTGTAETLFASPSGQQYRSNGILYGARMMDQINGLDIDNPIFAENLSNYIQQCVIYDIYLNRKSLDSIGNSADIFADLQSDSVSLLTPMRPNISGVSAPVLTPCNQAYTALAQQWTTYWGSSQGKILKVFYPELPKALARAKATNDLPLIYGAITANAANAEKIIQHSMMMNSFMAARNGGPQDSTIDAFTQARADVQTSNSYNTIGAAARKWVPILGMILTVVFYSLFPIIFLLFLLPNTGYATLKGYFVGFLYLASWGPIYAILNMFLVNRYGASVDALAGGGLTLSNRSGVQNLNGEISELAGYLIAFVPFLAAGITKGAMAVGSLSHSFLGPAQSAASAAAADKSLGNTSLGNTSWQNLQANNASTFQQSLAPALNAGSGVFRTAHPSGATTSQYAGAEVFDYKPSFSQYSGQLNLAKSSGVQSQSRAAFLQNESRDLRQTESDVQTWSKAFSNTRGASDTTSAGTQSASTDYTDKGNQTGKGIIAVVTKGNSVDNSDILSRTDSTGKTSTSFLSGEVYGDASATAKVGTPLGGVIGSEASAQATLGARGSKGWRGDSTDSTNLSNSDNTTTSENSGSRVDHSANSGSFAQNGFRTENGSFRRVSHDEFSGWNAETRNAYSKALSEEISDTESAAKTYEQAASYYSSDGVNVNQNLDKDFERYVTQNSDYSGFAGNGRSFLQKSYGEKTPAERTAYDKAVSDFTRLNVDDYALRHSADADFIKERFDAKVLDLESPQQFQKQSAGNGGGASGPDGASMGIGRERGANSA